MTQSAGYSGTPLPRKLGIKAGHRVLLSGAPPAFTFDSLPADVELDRAPADGRYDVILVFCPDAAALHAIFMPLKALLHPTSALWIGWTKQASKIPTDLTEADVRCYGLEHGLVDVKVCSIDSRWSGLTFVYRVIDRPTVSSTQA